MASWRKDGLVSRYMTLVKRTPMKELDVLSNFGPGKSNEDMFSYIWNSEEALALTPPFFCKDIDKSIENSKKYLAKGNFHLIQNHDEALKHYNESILAAPHPSNMQAESSPSSCVGNNSTVKKKKDSCEHPSPFSFENYGTLAKAYENRTTLLFKLKQYELCIRDIDLSLKFGCPEASIKSLHELRSACINCKAAEKSSSSDDAYDLFSYECPDPPTLDNPNPALPSLSAGVRLACTHTQGRYLVADRDIRPGEVVGVEESYVAQVGMKFTKQFCNVCLKRSSAPLPCYTCSMVVFCSEECQRKGMTGCHRQECRVLPTFCILDLGDYALQAFKVMMKIGYSALKPLLQRLQTEAAGLLPEMLGFNSEGLYDGTHYRSVYHLVTKKDKRSNYELLGRCLQAFIVTKLLQQSEHFFITSDNDTFTPSEEDLLLTGTTVFHHLMSLTCNSVVITELQIMSVNMYGVTEAAFGGGVYPTLSLLNHSCNSTCHADSYGKVRVLRAFRFIPAGSAVTVSYGCQYRAMPLPERKKFLMNELYFLCKCEACENKWPSEYTFASKSSIKLKCVKCSQAVNHKTRKCDRCCIKYNKCVPVNGTPNLTSYNYNCIMRKIRVAETEYNYVQKKIMEDGILSEEEMRGVTKTVELVCKYVVEPHPLCNAQGIVMAYYGRQQARTYAKQNQSDCPVC